LIDYIHIQSCIEQYIGIAALSVYPSCPRHSNQEVRLGAVLTNCMNLQSSL